MLIMMIEYVFALWSLGVGFMMWPVSNQLIFVQEMESKIPSREKETKEERKKREENESENENVRAASKER